MAYVNLSNEQAAKLASTLGPEFTAVAKNELLSFADAILGASKEKQPAKPAVVKEEAAPSAKEETKAATKSASKKA